MHPYNSRDDKLLFLPHFNTTYFGTKSLRCNGPLTWSNFSQSMNNNNNFFNVGISTFKKFLNNSQLQSYE